VSQHELGDVVDVELERRHACDDTAAVDDLARDPAHVVELVAERQQRAATAVAARGRRAPVVDVRVPIRQVVAHLRPRTQEPAEAARRDGLVNRLERGMEAQVVPGRDDDPGGLRGGEQLGRAFARGGERLLDVRMDAVLDAPRQSFEVRARRRRDHHRVGRPAADRFDPPAASVVAELAQVAQMALTDGAETGDVDAHAHRRSATRNSYGSGIPPTTSGSPPNRVRWRSSSTHSTRKPSSSRNACTASRAKIE
jgi:hypothetical protein